MEEEIKYSTKDLANMDPLGVPRSRHECILEGYGTLGLKMISHGAELLDRAHLFVQ